MKECSDKQANGFNRVWIWGWHAVNAILLRRSRKIFAIYALNQHFSKISAMTSLKISVVSLGKMNDMFGRNHQGIAIYVEQIKFWDLNTWLEAQPAKSTLIACDLIEDPHNLGAIIRTAAAFSACGILVTKLKSAPFEGVLSKSAAGGLEFIPIIAVANLATSLKVLQKNGYMVYGLDEGGLMQWDISERNVIVLGQEGRGLRDLTRRSCDVIIGIDTNEEFPTLNVSVAAGIAVSRFLDR